jgi:hypothetical protein
MNTKTIALAIAIAFSIGGGNRAMAEFFTATTAEPGTLADCIGEKLLQIDSLAVTGPIGNDDFITMCEASFSGKLVMVDLSAAQIQGNAIPNSAFSAVEFDAYGNETCAKFQKIVLPEGITEIGKYAFWRDKYLREVNIPSSVKSIGSGAFYCCLNLSVDPLIIPEGVEEIPYYCFQEARSLKRVVLPSSIRYIGESAFEYSTVEEINFPDGLLGIAGRAFVGALLHEVSLPQSCTRLTGESIFSTNRYLAKAELPEGIDSIPTYFLRLCESLTQVNIPSSVTTIGEEAFLDCISLQSVELPEGLTKLDEGAFMMTGLTEVTLPYSLESVGKNCFKSAANLAHINSKATTPPTCVGSMPMEAASAANVELRVPTGSAQRYREAAGWRMFSQLVESDELIPAALEGVRAAEPMSFEAKDGGLRISGNGAYAVYSTDGRLVGGGACSEAATVDLAPGIYVVRTAAATTKVAVK